MPLFTLYDPLLCVCVCICVCVGAVMAVHLGNTVYRNAEQVRRFMVASVESCEIGKEVPEPVASVLNYLLDYHPARVHLRKSVSCCACFGAPCASSASQLCVDVVGARRTDMKAFTVVQSNTENRRSCAVIRASGSIVEFDWVLCQRGLEDTLIIKRDEAQRGTNARAHAARAARITAVRLAGATAPTVLPSTPQSEAPQSEAPRASKRRRIRRV